MDRWLAAARDSRGSALAEFAITVPMLALVTMASMAVMQIIAGQFGIQAAAREGAAVGANVSSSLNPLGKSKVEALEEIELILTEYNLDIDSATVTFEGNDPLLRRGSFFRVQLSYDVPLLEPTIPFFGQVVGGEVSTFTVFATAVMPVQKHRARWPCPSPDPICS